jgi:hypothetical protein
VEISCRRFGTTYRSRPWGSSGNFFPTFRDNLSVPPSGFKWKLLAVIWGQPIGPVLGGSSCNLFPTFKDNLSVPHSGFKWKLLAVVWGQPIGPALGVQVVIYFRRFGTSYRPTFGTQVEISCHRFGRTYRSRPWDSSDNLFPTFRDNLSVPILMVQELET